MAILAWSDQLEIGIPSVDEQHKRLVAILNQLDEVVSIGDEPQKIFELINALVDYTQYKPMARLFWTNRNLTMNYSRCRLL